MYLKNRTPLFGTMDSFFVDCFQKKLYFCSGKLKKKGFI